MSHTPITGPELLEEAGLGVEAYKAFLFLVDQALIGVAGFGPTIKNVELDEEEYALLRHMLTSCLVHLKNSESFEKIQQLNEDLVQRNEDLTQTIAELREARHTIALLEKAKAHIKAMVEREMEKVGKVRPLDFVFILVVAVCVGILFNLTNPNAIPLFPGSLMQPAGREVDMDTARSLMDSGTAVLVDARPKEMFDQKHIRGAISVPLALFDILYVMKLSSMDLEKLIIVYGRTISRHYDKEMVLQLKRKDHDNVAILSGGLKAWEARGYEVEP
jgi:rhodanese-related sulfurtransferase